MKILAVLVALTCFFTFMSPVLAGSPPELSSPANNSTTSTTTLTWQQPSYQLYSGNAYRVQVDDDQAFGSLNKDYYTANTNYSPNLDDGVWYWRVKAKDSTNTWSDWSSIWSFTLNTSTPTSDPPPTSTPDSSSPSPTSNPSNSSSFNISSVPQEIHSSDSFSVSVDLNLPNSPNTLFYLKGAFKKSDSSNYFGLTKVSSEWVKNGASYSDQFSATTDGAGHWSGSLTVQPDPEDSGFEGTGDYIFKVGRYTSSGSGPTWSNEVTLKIVGDTTSSTNTGSKTSTPAPSPTYAKSTPSLSKSDNVKIKSPGVVAGIFKESTPSSSSSVPETQNNVEVKKEQRINFVPIIGGLLMIAGAISLACIYLSQHVKFSKWKLISHILQKKPKL